MATPNSPYPRWKQLIAQGIKDGMANKEKGVLYYTLSTVEASQPPVPHARTVVHRGFVNEQRSSKSQTGVEPFDSNFGSNACLVTTTDIRAPKAQHIIQNFEKNGSAKGEVSWWMEGKNLQFRLAGTLTLVPRKDHPSTKVFDLSKLDPVSSSKNTSKDEAFDWYKERTRIFEKLSPGLLASFARPTPGSQHPQEGSAKLQGKGPGEGSEDDGKDDLESPWPLELPQPGKEETQEQKTLLAESEKKISRCGGSHQRSEKLVQAYRRFKGPQFRVERNSSSTMKDDDDDDDRPLLNCKYTVTHEKKSSSESELF